MKAVLVTGGAGYIGSHACKALAEAGYAPIAFDNLAFGHRWAVRWGPLVQGDVLDRGALDDVLREYKPVAVMHLAAFAYVGESMLDPGRYFRNNVVGSLNLAEAMRDAGVGQLVFSSSCATYGVPHTIPIPESHPQHPVSPYGASKLMTERMLKDFGHAHGLRSITLRYFNAAGADASCEIGESHDPETHLIPLALDTAAGIRPDITIFGDQFATRDGTCVRDYIHVTDLAQAHMLALQALEAGQGSAAYNLGNGQGFTVREVIATARQVTGREIRQHVGPARAGDPPSLVGDASLIRAKLGWHPRHPDLHDIIDSAWQWHQRRQQLRGTPCACQ